MTFFYYLKTEEGKAIKIFKYRISYNYEEKKMAINKISMKDYNRFIENILNELEIGKRVNLLTFKRDRKVSIIKISNEKFAVEEDGFKQKKFDDLNRHQVIKLMDKLRDIEFPRSNMLHINRK